MDLSDKVVVVTGAGSGIGAAAATRFAAEGAHVVLTDIAPGPVAAVSAGVGGLSIAADVTDEDDVRAVAALAMNAFGRIDLWFSNAGISTGRAPGVIPDNAQWERMWALHVMSHVYAARAVLPSMLERGEGYLLQTASRVAIVGHPDKAAYSVTKHAALALGEWLAMHYRSRGIRVSCFCRER